MVAHFRFIITNAKWDKITSDGSGRFN
jgi:hypothetical protein